MVEEEQKGRFSGMLGEYEIGRTLGEGLTAKVKLGRKDGQLFAIKILKGR